MNVGDYLAQIGRYPLLSPEEEKDTACRARNGDRESRELMINSNLRLVVSIAKNYSSNGNLEDLIQEGNCGLINAVDNFNPDFGNRLSTYAVWFIRQSIFKYFERSRGIRIPSRKIAVINNMMDLVSLHISEKGKEPSKEYIAERLSLNLGENYSENDVSELLGMYNGTKLFSLNNPLGNDGCEYSSLLEDETCPDVVKSVSNRDIAEIISKEIESLDADEEVKKMIFNHLYEKKDYREIAEMTGRRREDVRQKCTSAIRVLRSRLISRGITNN